MKHLTLSLVAMAICIFNDGDAFGQSPQGSDGTQGGIKSESTNQTTPKQPAPQQTTGTSQPTQWNPCHDPHCSRCESRWTRPLFPNSCVAKCRATKAFPDAGWNPPAHMPVNYDGVWYGSYLPQHAYGTPGGGFIANYPTVYQPTDTTQLGYYYHKVPTWQSRPDMIPGVPYPGNFHARVYAHGGTGWHGYHGGSYGPVNYGPVPASCPNGNSSPASAVPQNFAPQNSARQNSTPNSRQVVRTAQPERQGLFDGLRLASMTELFD